MLNKCRDRHLRILVVAIDAEERRAGAMATEAEIGDQIAVEAQQRSRKGRLRVEILAAAVGVMRGQPRAHRPHRREAKWMSGAKHR